MASEEGDKRQAETFSRASRDRELERLFHELNAEGQRSVMERAQAHARARGFREDSIGWGLTVLRNRNEILAAEIGATP
jgi:hypothetical protein